MPPAPRDPLPPAAHRLGLEVSASTLGELRLPHSAHQPMTVDGMADTVIQQFGLACCTGGDITAKRYPQQLAAAGTPPMPLVQAVASYIMVGGTGDSVCPGASLSVPPAVVAVATESLEAAPPTLVAGQAWYVANDASRLACVQVLTRWFVWLELCGCRSIATRVVHKLGADPLAWGGQSSTGDATVVRMALALHDG